MDTYLCNKRLLLKQRGDCVARQINFPLPHTHLTPHEALIQPLLSPLASADWLTYGIALFCFSSSPRSPENQTLLPVNLFWFFCLEERAPLPFFRHARADLNQSVVSYIWRDDAACFSAPAANIHTHTRGVTMPRCSRGGYNAIARDLSRGVGGSYRSRLNAGIFDNYSESAQRSFILHWLRKAHLQHAFDIRVTQRGIILYTTVAATDHSEAGFTNGSYLLVSTLKRAGSQRAGRTSNNTINCTSLPNTMCRTLFRGIIFFFFFFSTIHELTWHLGTKSQPSKFSNRQSFLRVGSTTCVSDMTDKRENKKKKENLWKRIQNIVLYHQRLLSLQLDWMVCLKPQFSRS